ncbi:MAG: GTP-binding protein [Thermoplasmata archaeon]|nr:GTP-binding protein [Thermoplasmata archaeon]
MIKFVRKVCLVGDPEVGKTCLVRKFVIDKFDDSYIMTMGAKVMKKECKAEIKGEEHDVNLMIWDVMGQKHFRIIESVAFEHVAGAMIVCDLTRKSTAENIGYWIEALTSISGDIPLIILANKNDLADEAEYGEELVAEIAAKYDASFYMTSALTGVGIEDAFAELARLSIKKNFD